MRVFFRRLLNLLDDLLIEHLLSAYCGLSHEYDTVPTV